MSTRRHFSDINSFCYTLASRKEILRRHLQDCFSKKRFAQNIESERLPVVVSSYSCNLIKRGKGMDLTLQENKAVNIRLACSKINGMVIHPGEVFSFWRTVGKPSRKRGYKDGRVLEKHKLKPGPGGGLCNLGNTINRLVLHSPMDIVEFHKHSDALAPDEGKRIPLSAGTSVYYNYVDYRFQNNTDGDIQLLLWCDEEKLYGELRSKTEFPWRYELIEEDHHFEKEDDIYYRVSKIYRNIISKATGNVENKELIWDNHSQVMYDENLIPKDQIRI